MINLLEQVKKTVNAQALLKDGEKVLVALSGGADSVCLLDAMLSLAEEFSISVYAAHIHHGLRGQDADDDEAYVRKFCKMRNVPLFVHHEDVSRLAKETKRGIEETGRLVRYEFLYGIKNQEGIHKIATAHHSGDAVETVLMRLMRGTGLKGLAGIPYQNGDVIRPLLDVSRDMIEEYCRKEELLYQTDATNFETEYTRNRVRNELIPYIEEHFNPSFKANFKEKIKQYSSCYDYVMQEANELYQNEHKPVSGGVSFSCSRLLCKHPFLVSTMLHSVVCQYIKEQNITSLHIGSIIELLSDNEGMVTLPEQLVAEVCHGELYIHKAMKATSFCYDVEDVTEVPEAGITITCSYLDRLPEKRESNVFYLDVEKIKGKKLYCRSRRDGDFFYPVGMMGKKKLQDFFVDQKLPRFLRGSVPIITVEDDIAWIVGYRGDERYAINQNNDAVLRIEIHKGEQN